MHVCAHPDHDVLTFLQYESTGHVRVKVTGGAGQSPYVTTVPLATFLRDIGIPFESVAAVPQSEPVRAA